mmetsp:Transcript_8440/g.31233  ORF Transcript_8440/g.31233 Transcript_8440/m.31233 type:complete len:837 (-) Transcript_8440:2252-4762(-)
MTVQHLSSFDSASFVRRQARSNKTGKSSHTSNLTSSSSSTNGNNTHSHSHTYWFAIILNKARQMGLAIMNVNSSVITLSEYVDNANYSVTRNMIEAYGPKKLLFPKTLRDAPIVQLLGEVTVAGDNLPYQMQFLSRALWNEVKGQAYLESLSAPELLPGIRGEIVNKYLCVSSLAALIVFVEHNQQVSFVPSSLSIKYKSAEGFMLIDSSAIKNLELLQNLSDGTVKNSLFSLLNNTMTPMGARMLRMNILQPFTDISTIALRQKAVDEILHNEEEYYTCRGALQAFCFDMDHMVSSFSSDLKEGRSPDSSKASKIILNMIALKICLESIEDVVPALAAFESPLLTSIRQALDSPSREQLSDDIIEYIDPNVVISKSKDMNQCNICFALRPEISEFLNTTREVYTELHEDIYILLEKYKEESSLETIKVMHSTRRGFYLSVENSETIPPEYNKVFIQRYSYKKRTTFSSLELNSLNIRLKEVTEDILQLTASALEPLINSVRSHLAWLVSVTESLAVLDILFALASVVCSAPLRAPNIRSWNQPLFTEQGPIAIKRAKHPLLTCTLGEQVVVPNDFFLSSSQNFVIITGANMSGKTISLKTLGTIQILAQIGSPVPAEYCSLRCMNQLFTRISTDDSLETHSSSFMVEMREMANIIQNARDHSLILIDELGRATSNSDATAISFAISEYILSMDAFTCFVTHIPQLTELDSIYPNVKNMHTVVRIADDEDRIDYLYELKGGTCEVEGYGLKLARVLKLPRGVLNEASQIYDKIQEEKKRTQRGQSKTNMLRKLASRISTLCQSQSAGSLAWKQAARRLQQSTKGMEKVLLQGEGDP